MTFQQKPTCPHEVTKLVDEVLMLSDDEAYSQHGIEIYDDGVVYDSIDDVEYENLTAWSTAQVSAMYDPKFEKRHSPHGYDD
jgi:hypothetical protein